MGLLVAIEGNQHRLSLKEFQQREKVFVCEADDAANSEVFLEYPLVSADPVKPDEYVVYLLGNPALHEEHIYQVYDKDRQTRIGWCFPIQALTSTSHSHTDNNHFLRYARAAAELLITSAERPNYIPDLPSTGLLRFDDFFHVRSAVLVISLAKLNFQVPRLERWVPSLATYGYSPLREHTPDDLVALRTRDIDVRINLITLPDTTPNLDFIEQIFGELVPQESAPHFRLFYLYQVIELLLDAIYRAEQKNILERLREAIADSLKVNEVIDYVSDLMKEKRRLNILREKYLAGNRAINTAQLRDACNRFLLELGYKENTDPYMALYLVRNVLFHKYREIPPSADISAIADELLIVLPEVLHGYVTATQVEVNEEGSL